MGGIVTEEKHRITNEKTIELNSLDENQLFIGGGLFVVGIMNLLIFGGSLGSRYIILGSTFQFQGPSYFFSVGLIPLIIGLIFLIFAGLNARKLIINEKENQILIKESYFYRKKEYEIDKSKSRFSSISMPVPAEKVGIVIFSATGILSSSVRLYSVL